MIGNDIVITVLEIHHDHVRIGIDAPRAIDVHREEVYRLVRAANEAAMAQGGPETWESLRGLAPESGGGAEAAAAPARPVAKLRKPAKDRGAKAGSGGALPKEPPSQPPVPPV